MRIPFLAVALLAGVATVSAAQAGTVAIQPITDNARLTSVGLSFDSGATFNASLAGQLKIRRTGGTDTSFQVTDFFTFCVEPTEFLAAVVMDLTQLREGDTARGGMGQARANQVEQLFARFLPDVHTEVANDVGAALQIAIWEIVREDGGMLALTDGSFRVQAPGAITTLADSYLDALTADGPELSNLLALINRGNQDLLAQVPTPASLALFGLGVAGIAASRRRAR